ncbi:WD40 repeat domain-containing serine/threonine protein kinase [Actinoallomurus sp. CA-150999]|uniref:WD40 repeat domain-containing serine/threonine protein kinase n=1 Tax=Actinoallomurus sp. CA-150999 TaxID=3239887 RepID=UPI003D909872
MRSGLELVGRYRLETPLGRGGMGEVWQGVDLRLRRRIAVKILPLTVAADKAMVARFRREAEIAATLNHPGITTVYDIDEDQYADQRLLFLVMELMQGRDLAAVLAGHPDGLPIAQATDWAVQVLDALAVAHRQGVVHRDIKPANLFLVDGGRVKVCDFGIARLADATKITATGSSAGTPLYMAPEQIQGRTVDQRTDLYAFGCVLYQMLTGITWVDTSSGVGAILYQHLDRAPAPPRSVRPDIPARLDALVLDLLAKQPGDRPGDAATIAERLRASPEQPHQAHGRQPAPAVVVLPPTEDWTPSTHAQPATPEAVARDVGPAAGEWSPSAAASKRIGRRTVLLGGLGAAALAAVPVAVLLSETGRKSAPPTTPVSPVHPTARAVTVARVDILACGGYVDAVAFSREGKTLATCQGHTARLWNVTTRKTTATLTGHPKGVDAVAFSPDGRTLATGSFDKTVRLWNVTTGKTTAILTGHTGTVSELAYSPDGRILATGSYDKTVRLWNGATGNSIATLTGHPDWISGVAFSPDGRTLAVSSRDGTTRMWDMASRKTTATLDYSAPLAFSPDGRTLATRGPDNTVLLRDIATGKTTATLTGHTSTVGELAYSPDGRILATGSYDKTARLWDTATGISVATLTGHTSFIFSVAFSPDGTTLATGAWDNTTRLWKIQ